jgi:hypothetical protein
MLRRLDMSRLGAKSGRDPDDGRHVPTVQPSVRSFRLLDILPSTATIDADLAKFGTLLAVEAQRWKRSRPVLLKSFTRLAINVVVHDHTGLY